MKSLYPLLIGGHWHQSDDTIDVINLARVEAWVGEARAAGAKILTGRRRRDNFYKPTSFSTPPPR